MRRVFSILLASALLLGFGFVMATPVAAATLTVDTSQPNIPPNYHTIQAAIDAASSGDTIEVAAGTYEESLTIPSDKTGLTLLGAQAGVDARGAQDSDGWHQGRTGVDESIIDAGGGGITNIVRVNAEGVTIDGFTIRNVFQIQPFGRGNTLTNNIIMGEEGGIGVVAVQIVGQWGSPDQSPLEDLTIEKNWIKDTKQSGFYQQDASINLRIVDNLFTDMGHSAIILGGVSDRYYTDTLIARNQIKGTQAAGINVSGGEKAGLAIEDNIVESAGWGYPAWFLGAIRLYGNFPYVDLSIQGNILIHSVCGITFLVYTPEVDDWTDVTIENNFIGYNQYGIYMTDYAGAVPGGISAHYNAITCNVYGVFTYEEPFDATNNWWGSNDGPSGAGSGSGDPVTDNVIYDPWLVLTLTADPPSVSPGGTSVITADVTTNSDGDDAGASIPDGTPILFATSSSSVDPELAIAQDGVATTTYTAGTVPGTVSATAPCYPDNTVLLDVSLAPTPAPPTAGIAYPSWAVLLAGLMAGATLLALRRRQTQS